MKRGTAARLRALLDRLDDRLELQTAPGTKGADHTACTKIVGSYHDLAGWIERSLCFDGVPPSHAAIEIRSLRRLLLDHRVAVDLKAKGAQSEYSLPPGLRRNSARGRFP